MTFQALLDEVANNLQKILLEMDVSVDFSVEPARPDFGDASSNVAFLLAKSLKEPPRDISKTLSVRYSELHSTLVLRAEAHPSGYLNFVADWPRLSQLVLSESHLAEFGNVDVGGGTPIVVEHTSVNPNKALHIGHVRNIIIGDVVSRVLRKANHAVNVLNYVDDSGLQVADIIVGFRHLGFGLEPPDGKKFDQYCGDDVYVRTTAQYKKDPGLEEIRSEVLQQLEDGGSETAQFADKLTRRVLGAQLETCWNLSVYYDCLNFESQIVRSGMWSATFEKLKEMRFVELEDAGKNKGCWVVRRKKQQDKVIVRSNGTATYVAKDIPYAAWKLGLLDDPFHYSKYEGQPSRDMWQTTLSGTGTKKNYTADRVITVIDSRQTQLQEMITSLMDRFKSAPGSYVHLGYESVTLSSKTANMLGLETDKKQAQMSGRQGLYVHADYVYEALKEKAAAETKKRNPQMPDSDVDGIAHHISVGTIRYEMIKQDLDKIIVFDLEDSLSLEGNTAPYIQYAFARASRILEKSASAPAIDVDFSLLGQRAELDLVRLIGLFDAYVSDSARNLSPKVMARYCHDLAAAFNLFYEKSKVLNLDDPRLEAARLCLVNSFRLTIRQALSLVGIVAPEKM